MNAWVSFRLAVWREWHSVGIGFVLLAGLLVVSLSVQGAGIGDKLAIFVVLVVAPWVQLPLVGGGRSDRYWRGLGGPGWAQYLGMLVALGAPTFTLLFLATWNLSLRWPGSEQVWELLPAGLLLFALSLTARTVFDGVERVAGYALGALSLVFGWALLEELGSRAWLSTRARVACYLCLGLLLLAGAFLWQRRYGPWSGSLLKLRRWTIPAAALLGLIGASATYATAPPGSIAYPMRAPDLRSHTFLIIDGVQSFDALMRGMKQAEALGGVPGRVRHYYQGVQTRLPYRRVIWASPGPVGTVALARYETLWRRVVPGFGGTRVDLVTADGRRASCTGLRGVLGNAWRSDGRAVVVSAKADPTAAYVLDIDQGCRALGPEVEQAVWVGDELLTITGRELRLGDRVLETWGPEESRWLKSEEGMVGLRSMPKRLSELADDAGASDDKSRLREIASNSRTRMLGSHLGLFETSIVEATELPGGGCALTKRPDGSWFGWHEKRPCWDRTGHPIEHGCYRPAKHLGPHLVVDWEWVTDLRNGQRVMLPPSEVKAGRGDALMWPEDRMVLEGDGIRLLSLDAYWEISLARDQGPYARGPYEYAR